MMWAHLIRRAALTAALALSPVLLGHARAADGDLALAIGGALHNVQGDFSTVPDAPFNRETHACIGEKTVAVLGAARLEQLGVTSETAAAVLTDPPLTRHGFAPDEIEHLLDAIDGCLGFSEIWVFLALNNEETRQLIQSGDQREALAACLRETPGNASVRALWKVLFTEPGEAFQAEYAARNEQSMACYADTFCGPAYAGSVMMPMTLGGTTMMYSQTLVMPGLCPFEGSAAE